MKGVAPRQLDVLRFVHDYRQRYDFAPTHREIAEALGLASMAGVSQHLTALKRKGLLVRHSNKQRALSLTESAHRLLVSRCDNVCEHGDHPAPEGQRFCSRACAACEHTDHDAMTMDCAGICLQGRA